MKSLYVTGATSTRIYGVGHRFIIYISTDTYNHVHDIARMRMIVNVSAWLEQGLFYRHMTMPPSLRKVALSFVFSRAY